MKRLLASAGLGCVLVFMHPGQGMSQTSAVRATVVPASPAETANQKAVLMFLREYFSALAQGEVEKLTKYHPTLSPEQIDVLRDYFAHTIRDLQIRLDQVQVNVAADTASVAFSRTDTFVDRPTGRRVEKSIQLSTMLVQGAQGWRLAGVDQIAFALAGNRVHIS